MSREYSPADGALQGAEPAHSTAEIPYTTQRDAIEDAPTHQPLGTLTPDEADVYASLADGEFGPNVRLEQERVRYHLLEVALNDLHQGPR